MSLSEFQRLTDAQGKEIVELMHNRAERGRQRRFVVEGAHLAEAALSRVPQSVEAVILTELASDRDENLVRMALNADIQIYRVSARTARKLADADTPQGILTVVSMPRSDPPSGEFVLAPSGRFVLALDRVQDPGNVGTLIRTASWFGVDSVLLGAGTADAYSPKVLRATQGAIFDLPIHRSENLVESLAALKASGSRVLVAMLASANNKELPLRHMEPVVLVLGNEASGVSPEIASLADQTLFIPRGSGAERRSVESLNVAVSGALLLAKLAKVL